MRVGLIFNQHAGDASGAEDLVARIGRHGHVVRGVASPHDGVRALPLGAIDVLVVAGGDGTVGSIAATMPIPDLPLAVLPTGTANNIATSLGVPADPDQAIAAWQRSRVQRFDIGVATGPWGERRFVESVGGGLVTHGTVVMDRKHYRSPTSDGQLTRARHAHADVLAEAPAVAWRLVLDGALMERTLVLLEVLNVAKVGPSLALAAASPFDGQFTMVCAGPEHRLRLQTWLRDGADEPAPPLTVLQCREIVIEHCDRLHVDDEVTEVEGPTSVTLRVDPGAVSMLVPTES